MAVKGIINWVNPSTNTDGTAYDASKDNAGYTLQLDGVGQVSIPLAYGTSFDMNSLDAYKALKSDKTHTAALQVVNKAGVASDFSAAATFSVVAVPSAPSSVSVA